MKVLVVEDETKTAAYLRQGLTEAGFVVDLARDGQEGLHLAQSGGYQAVILDVMLPGLDGWEVLAELRRGGDTTPVLFLTARDAVPDRVKGLELGADDYLVKPFAFAELLARVRTLLRRGQAQKENVVRVADLALDFQRHAVTRGGRRLEVTPREFALLGLLMQRKGEALSRTLIADEIWGMRVGGDSNVVDVHIRRLRAKVDDPFEGKLIHTVRGVGYVLEER